jgi:hypothetical protein
MSFTGQESALSKGYIPEGGAFHGVGDKAAEGTIPFGCAVELGTDKEKQYKKFVGGEFQGVAVADPTKDHIDLDGSNNEVYRNRYEDTVMVSVMRRGPVQVEVDEAVSPTDAVYANAATANFGKTSGGGNVAVPNAKFRTTGAGAGSIVTLDLNLP